MQAVLQEIVKDGQVYNITDNRVRSKREIPLEVVYQGSLHPKYKDIWRSRRESIFDKSGVWRPREANNFLGINTDSYEELADNLVSFDGGENADIGPYHLRKAAEHAGLENGNTYFLLLNKNPAGSFKAGGMVALLTQGRRLGMNQYICASTGNTAETLAAAVANERAIDSELQYLERPRVVVPRGNIAPAKMLGAVAYRAIIEEIDGTFDDALRITREEVRKNSKLYPANSYNPFRIEGQKTEMYVALEHFGYDVPDWIVTPGGNLGSATAIHKWFKEMNEWGWISKMPRLAIVNSAAANTLDYLVNKEHMKWDGNVDIEGLERVYSEIKAKYDKEPRKSDMSAIHILAPAPENLYKTLRALHEMNGVVISVDDEEAWDAKAAIDSNGMGLVDVASASTVAGMKKLRELGFILSTDIVLGRITGTDKDPEKTLLRYLNPRYSYANTPREL